MKCGLASAAFGAMLLADEINGRDNAWASTFAPTRLSLRSAHEVAQLGAKVSADLVGDRPPGRSLDGVRAAWRGARGAQSARQERRLPRRGRHAACGSLRCSHLGCLVRLNAAERSCDCRCHGSRFAVDGSVLEGTAAQPLERRTA